MHKQFNQILAHALAGSVYGFDTRMPYERRTGPPKKCIMCGKPREKDSLFCDGKTLYSGRTCKEVFRSNPKYWDKECK